MYGAIGLGLRMTGDIGATVWPLLNFPILLVFRFDYLVLCSYDETLYLWPLHMGLLAATLYVVFAIAPVAYKKGVERMR